MTVSALPSPPPPRLAIGREAHEPPEARGLRRDGVRLLVAAAGQDPVQATFAELPRFLEPGDLVVVNTSATLPAALDGRAGDGTSVRIHVSSPLPDGLWLVEPRRPAGVSSGTHEGEPPGLVVALAGGATAHLLHRYARSRRLWVATLETPEPLIDHLRRWGEPIRYQHITHPWPIEAYQTAYAAEPGSAEMPSAGRPLSTSVITALVTRGVTVAPLLLHSGVSSLEGDEDPYPERFRVPVPTARLVNDTHNTGGRVIAVGTTVVRALETVVDTSGIVHPGAGWTELTIDAARGVLAVDGLLTGFHDPRASHLGLLEAIAGRAALERSYAVAAQAGFLWHEFGDSHLILASRG